MALTDSACKNAKPTDKTYKKADSGGLYLEVSPHGGRYWRFKYRFSYKEKRLSFGVYPNVSLAQARTLRDEAKKLLAAGTDPSAAKKEHKRQATLNAEHTFEALAREWHGRQKSAWTSRYAENVLHRMEMDIFPQIGGRPISEISAPEFLAVLHKIEKRGAFEIARRALQSCGQVFRYAIVTGRAERNPAADMKGALTPVKHGHFAAIEADELPDFLKALEGNEARLYFLTRCAVKLLLLTFVRTSELIEARWSEFNLEGQEWGIPAERMKMRRPHLVPLSKQAVAVLKELQALTGGWDFVFPNLAHPKKHMSNNTVLGALKRLGYKGRMTGHGFRALAMSTLKERLGYRHEVVDRQLAHAHANKVDAAYDRAKFLSERKKMMQNWADYLDGCRVKAENVIRGKFYER